MKKKILVSMIMAIGLIIGLTGTGWGLAEHVGNISVAKVAPGGGSTLFYFDGDLGLIALADGYAGTHYNIPAGDYTITETVPADWLLTDVSCVGGDCTPYSDASGEGATVHLDAGEHITVTFTNIQTGNITAHKFNDLNGNGVQDAGEQDLIDWEMTLHLGSGCTGIEIAQGVTDGSGNVTFSSLISDNYSVEETLQDGWQNMTYICQDVSLPPGVTEIASFGNQQEIYVSMDIKPESCPNRLSMKEKGVLPIGIMGMDDFDVTHIDPATIRLFRKDVTDPIQVVPLRWSLEDVGIPYEPFISKVSAYDCLEYFSDEFGMYDGYLDLSIKFVAQEVVAALGEINDGDVLVLQLTGKLKEEYGGNNIVGDDVVWILKKQFIKNRHMLKAPAKWVLDTIR